MATIDDILAPLSHQVDAAGRVVESQVTAGPFRVGEVVSILPLQVDVRGEGVIDVDVRALGVGALVGDVLLLVTIGAGLVPIAKLEAL